MSQDHEKGLEAAHDAVRKALGYRHGNMVNLGGVHINFRDVAQAAIDAYLRAASNDAEPVGWETAAEWELEQAVFSAANHGDVPEWARKTIGELWKQYCIAARPSTGVDEDVKVKVRGPVIKPQIIADLREWAEFEQDGGNVEQGAAIDIILDWYDRQIGLDTSRDTKPNGYIDGDSGQYVGPFRQCSCGNDNLELRGKFWCCTKCGASYGEDAGPSSAEPSTAIEPVAASPGVGLTPEQKDQLPFGTDWPKTSPAPSPAGGDAPAQHEWVQSNLGHGETMCKHCRITNREAAVLGELNTCHAPRALSSKQRSPSE